MRAILRGAFRWASPPLAVLAGGVLLAGCVAAARPDDSLTEPPRTNRTPVPVVVPVEEHSIDMSLEALLGHTPPPLEVRRNPFRFGPADDGDGHDLREAGPASAVPVPVEQLLNATSASAPLVAPPVLQGAFPVRFIGIVELRDRNRRVAVLADGDGVHHGAVDDVVLGRYRIVALGATSVEIEDVARGTRLVLRPGVP